ncbi:hypothetical protein ACWEF6_35015 [Amycolatopsis sp. NPDC004772]
MLVKKIASAAGVLAAAGGIMVSTAGTGAAATAGGDASSGQVVTAFGVTGTLPGCADYDHSGQDAWVINNCSYVIHAKILWAFASDSPCTKLEANGGWMTSWRSGLARYDGAVSC